VEVTKQNHYQDKWLTDETYFQAIKAQFPTLDDSFIRGLMNRAISVWGGVQLDDFSESNKSGMAVVEILVNALQLSHSDPLESSCRILYSREILVQAIIIQKFILLMYSAQL
jgi:hypothetical protein